jgi:hypothetical protein
MKKILSLLSLVVLAGSAVAQRSVVVNTNGLLTAPTNFWTANSNAINAVIAGGGSGAAWISTNARTSATNLNLGWLALTNTNANNFRNAIGLGTNNSPTFAAVNAVDPTFGGITTLSGGSVAVTDSNSLGITMNAAGVVAGRFFTTNGGVFLSTGLASAPYNVPGIWFSGPAAGVTLTNIGLMTNGTIRDTLLPSNVVTRATNGVALASAWTLTTAPTNGVATIETNQFGVGWDELGRFSVNTPVGILSMYSTGTPSTSTIYWPGTIVANRFSALLRHHRLRQQHRRRVHGRADRFERDDGVHAGRPLAVAERLGLCRRERRALHPF